MKIEIYDTLNYKDNPEIKSIINNENLYFSGKITKIRDWRWNHERNFIITDKAIYNLKNFSNQRKIDITKIKEFTISKLCNQIVIHGDENEYDYFIETPLKKNLIETVENIYEILTGKEVLFSIQNTIN